MADGQGTFGGGGSVKWHVTVDDGDVPQIKRKNGNERAYNVWGVDKHNKKEGDTTADFFVLHVQPPAGGTVKIVPQSNGGATVYVAIDRDNAEQIKVEWAVKESAVPATAQVVTQV
jgi:hypothetical protein